MPGRASSISPTELYNIAPSRFTTLSKVINNKRALDAAIMQHTFEMRKQAASLASGEAKQRTAGEYALKRQELANQRTTTSPEFKAADLAAKYASGLGLDVSNPEDKAAIENAYNMMLGFVQKPDANASDYPSPSQEPSVPGLTAGVNAGKAAGNTPGKVLDDAMAREFLRKAKGDKERARKMAIKMGYTIPQ